MSPAADAASLADPVPVVVALPVVDAPSDEPAPDANVMIAMKIAVPPPAATCWNVFKIACPWDANRSDTPANALDIRGVIINAIPKFNTTAFTVKSTIVVDSDMKAKPNIAADIKIEPGMVSTRVPRAS